MIAFIELSRGRGIKCLDSLEDIVNEVYGKKIPYVCQKYIENPLIINQKKVKIFIYNLEKIKKMLKNTKIPIFQKYMKLLCRIILSPATFPSRANPIFNFFFV